MTTPGQELFVVVDMMGAGRLVAAFDTEADAVALVGDFPEYYKIHRCRLNVVSSDALGWARDDAQRAHLSRFVAP